MKLCEAVIHRLAHIRESLESLSVRLHTCVLITLMNEATKQLPSTRPAIYFRKGRYQPPQISQRPHSNEEVPLFPLMTVTAQPGTPIWASPP